MATLHAKLALLIDGVYQTKATQLTIEFDPALNRVDTLDGFAGFTQGPGSCRITCSTAVDFSGLEFDFMSAIANVEAHDMQFVIGAQTYTSSGFFAEPGSVSQGVAANTEGSWTWVGDLKPLD